MKARLIATLLVVCTLISSTFAACPEIVTRASWGARAPKSSSKFGPAVGHVFIHHTGVHETCSDKASCSQLARETQNYHMNTKKWSDLSYSFLVGGDGRIYEGRGWKGVGAHTINYNSISLAICFMGNYNKVLPSAVMMNAAKDLIDCGEQQGYITAEREIHGHLDAKCTDCPGHLLYKDIQGWPGFKGGRLPGYTC